MFVGTKVTVGSFVPDDYAAMYCWANDVVAARLDGAFRPANLKDVIGWCETAAKDPSRVMLAIRRRTDPKIIGYMHIQNINAVHRSADIGIRIGAEQHRGHGYGTQALSIGLDYCWRHLNLERVGLIVFRDNARAISAYKAAGFKKEGLLKRLLFVDGAWVDVVIMAAFRPARRQSRRTDATVQLVDATAATANAGRASEAA
jgi:ribosomal-protein-alanine N-acetyltransferase